MSDFHEIVETGYLTPEEEARLRRTHELLVQAGPPPDLPPALERTPEAAGGGAEILQFPLLPRRRWAVAAVVAAAVAVIAFGGGYLLGHSKAKPSALAVQRVVPLHGVPAQGTANALGVLRFAKSDGVGNWPLEVAVAGLPRLSDSTTYYELWLTKHHTAVEPCGSFRVHGKTTTVRFTVPYALSGVDGWVVTVQRHGATAPGVVVLST